MSERPQSLWLRLPAGARSKTGSNPLPLPAKGRLVLGSGAEADVHIPDESIAAEHAVIAPLKDGGQGMRGLDEDNLPQRNGQPFRAVRLKLGDALLIGSHSFSIEAAPSARRAQEIEIPGFEVLRQIGRGAQARVFLATQESLDREVALKVLRSELGQDSRFVERFQTEARAAASLHHANVVTVFDVLEHKGRHLLVMEYMERGSLEDRLGKEGRLPWRAVLGILRDAAAGLEFAESRGLVHRDIKPANLMQNAAGVTKIADLGLATASESEEQAAKDKRIVGTPHFMAPEQARSGVVDARADLYALGSSAYRLLSARTPFSGQSPREILRDKLAGPPPPLAEFATDCPAELIELVEDLMASDPDDRPSSAAQLSSRIERLARATSSGAERDPEAAGSRSSLKLAIGAAGLALVGAGAWFFLGGKDEPTDDSGQTSALDDGTQEVAASEGESPPLEDSEPRPLAPERIGGDRPPQAAADEDAALRELEQQAAVDLASALASADEAIRKLELQQVAEEYAGTDAAQKATEALRELDTAEASPQPALNPELEAQRALVAFLGEARSAASPGGEWLPPHQAIAALTEFTPPSGIVDAAEFNQARSELAEVAREDLAAQARKSLDGVREVLRAGQFEQARSALEELFAWCVVAPLDAEGQPHFESPELTDTDRSTWPTGVRELPELTRAIQDSYAGLYELERLFERARFQSDRKRLAGFLGPQSGFAGYADRADPTAALELLAGAQAEVESPESRDRLDALAQTLEEAVTARKLIRESFDAGRWNRRSIRLPEGRRGGVEVLTLDDRGLVTEDETFALIEYGRDPEAVHLLFDSRIQGEWAPDERRAVASWIFVSALLRAQDDIAYRLDGRRGRFRPEELTAGFERVILWTQGGTSGATGRLQALAAHGALIASRLADGLDSARRGDAVRGAFQLEEALTTQFDHPLVAMLAAGTPLSEAINWEAICAGWMR